MTTSRLMFPLQFARLPHAAGLPLPAYATEGAAGLDLVAAVLEPLVIAPGDRVLVPTGLRVAVPPGHELQVRPRSGLALKHGLTIPNSPGTVDEDYRGELQVILLNLGRESFTVERGMRIAQAVLAPVSRALPIEVADLPETARGAGGFGSTGTGLVADNGGNFRLQWQPPAQEAHEIKSNRVVAEVRNATLRVVTGMPLPDGRVAMRDVATGAVEVMSWDEAKAIGLLCTRWVEAPPSAPAAQPDAQP